jgi:hypothetical protein
MPRCSVSISSIATPAAGPSFAVSISVEALDASWVRVTDELDIATGLALQQTLARGAGRFAADAGRPSRARFMDRTRVHVIIDATVHARQRDCRLAVASTAHRGWLLALPGTAGLVGIVALDTGEPATPALPSSPAGMRPHERSQAPAREPELTRAISAAIVEFYAIFYEHDRTTATTYITTTSCSASWIASSPRPSTTWVAAGARGQVIDRRVSFQTDVEDEFTAVIERLTDRRCRSAAHRRRSRLSPAQPPPVRAGSPASCTNY